MKEQSLALGQSVSYLRPDPSGAILSGTAIVHGLFIDHQGRKVVRLFDASQEAGKQSFNTDLLAVNYTPEFEAAYADLIKFVAEHGKEGNEASARVVSEYNARITAKYDSVVGAPLDAAALRATATAEELESIDLNSEEAANSMVA